jgi:fructose-bisphosphate aldolase, class II
MTLVNPLPYLQQAQREQFAIGAFNANTLEQVQAIVDAAQAEKAPAIIQISRRAAIYAGNGKFTLGLRYMAEIGRIAAESVTVPIALHLDHAGETGALQAIGLGFTSVMFDGADMPLEKNIAATRTVAASAHTNGVCLEAELVNVPRADNPLGVSETIPQTSPEDAAQFVAETHVDTLAVALGSVHAIKDKRIELDLDRLKAIREIVDIPLVLHGSSGVMDTYITRGIELGLCKINVATQLNQAFTRAVRSKLAVDGTEVDPRKYLSAGREEMTDAVRERIRFFGSAGKA